MVERVGTGLYRLPESGNHSNPDLVEASVRVPKVVILEVEQAFEEENGEANGQAGENEGVMVRDPGWPCKELLDRLNAGYPTGKGRNAGAARTACAGRRSGRASANGYSGCAEPGRRCRAVLPAGRSARGVCGPD